MHAIYEDIRRRWEITFADSSQTVNTLRQKGIRGSVCCEGLRSVCWKIYFGVLLTLNQSSWPAILDGERGTYESLCNIHIVDPAREAEATRADLNVNNPLSLEQDSPWQKYFEDNELRKIISQDVERTFPDQDYFRSPERQQQLIRILFIWCKLNLDVSYRQGMHELLAPVLWAVDADSIERRSEKSELSESGLIMEQVLDRKFVEHDAFALFERLMRATKPWYEFNDDPSWGRPRSAQKGKFFENPNGRFSITEIQKTPVVAECYKVSGLLKIVDPALYIHLESMSIEPQLYGIRWLRLLFSREFPLADVYQLWDGLFADDSNLGAVDYVCLGMLLYIRDDLLSSDYAGCLHRLMKFPPGVDVNILIEQAVKLREKTTPQMGARVIIQNARRIGRNVTDDVVSLAVQVERGDRQSSFNGGTMQHGTRYDSARERHNSVGSNIFSPAPVMKYLDRDIVKGARQGAGLPSPSNDDLPPPKQLHGGRNNGKKMESVDAVPRVQISASLGDARQVEKNNNSATAESTKEIERLRNVCLKSGEILQKIVEQLAPITDIQLSNGDAPHEERAIENHGSDTSPRITILLAGLTELMSVRDALLTEGKPTDLAVDSAKELNTSDDSAAKKITNPSSTMPKHSPLVAHAIPAPALQAIDEPIDASQSRPTTAAIVPSLSAISALSSSSSENGSSTSKSPTSPPVSRPLTVSAQAAKRPITSSLKLSLEDILNDGTEFANVGGPSNRIGIADSAHSWMFGEPNVGNQSPKKSLLFGGGAVGSLGTKMRLGGSDTSMYPSNEPEFTQPLAIRKDTSSQPLLLPIAPTSDPFNSEADNEIQDSWPEATTNVGVPPKKSESPAGACSPMTSQGGISSVDHGPKLLATKNDFDEQKHSDFDDRELSNDFISDGNVNFGHRTLTPANYIDESEIPHDPSAASPNDELERLSGNVWL